MRSQSKAMGGALREPWVIRSAVIAYVLAIVVIPLAAIVEHGLGKGLASLWRVVSSSVASEALVLTLWTAALVSVLNALLGTAVAWVMVRYRFPGRSVLSTLIDLPLAIPTLVAGLMLVILLGPASPVGRFLAGFGIKAAYSPIAILLALSFVTLPFVVRAVEPVLLELDPAEEEAAYTLGARKWTTFFRVLLPPMLPAVACGTILCFSRALAEFGSIVVVSGNIPHKTLTGAIFIFGEIEGGRSHEAAALSVVLLAIALALTMTSRFLERWTGVRRD